MRNSYDSRSIKGLQTKAQSVTARQAMLALALSFATFCLFVQIAHNFL